MDTYGICLHQNSTIYTNDVPKKNGTMCVALATTPEFLSCMQNLHHVKNIYTELVHSEKKHQALTMNRLIQGFFSRFRLRIVSANFTNFPQNTHPSPCDQLQPNHPNKNTCPLRTAIFAAFSAKVFQVTCHRRNVRKARRNVRMPNVQRDPNP